MTIKPADAIAPLYLLLCLLLGGASAAGVIANAFLQILGLVLLAGFALSRETRGRSLLGTRGFLLLVGATVLLVLCQLVPLPAAIWTHLPGRGDIAAGYRLLGIAAPGLPLSLDANATVAAGLSLLPPVAMAVATIHATNRSRIAALVVLVFATILSTLVGALQLSGGGDSPFYFYEITNPNKAVGFFANSNHLATLFLITLPCVAALAARENGSRRRRSAKGRRPMLVGIGLFCCFGLILNRSLAGLSMMLPVLLASFMLWRHEMQKPLKRSHVALGATAAALVMVFAFAGPLGGRFLEKTLSAKDPVTRHTTNLLTFNAAIDHLPFGTGLGTFVPVYASYEKPETISITYVNHAHDDYAEILLEAGLPGCLVLIAWLLWYARRTRDIWAGQTAAGSLARAASVMIGVVIVHSLVDYPIRTAAIAALVGLAAGLLAVPAPRVATAAKTAGNVGRHTRAD